MALHGFLGLPSDWDGLLSDQWNKVDWLKLVDEEIDHFELIVDRLQRQVGSVLLGYSMGGRLGLEMMTNEQARWKAAIIISSHPGLQSTEEREARREVDSRWSDRFRTKEWPDESENWTEIMEDWNAQPVFAGDPPIQRDEKDFNRDALAAALRACSLSEQPDYRTWLRKTIIPILWMAGERDEKYVKLATECAALNPRFELCILPNAGHRAPWGNPAAFRQAVASFLERHQIYVDDPTNI